jgi:hypothetical protein
MRWILTPAAILLGMQVASGPATAALSGYWDSSKVLHALLGQSAVADALKQQPIRSITATESGYRIESRDCVVDVSVKRGKVDRPGPSAFQIQVGHGHCR